MCKKTFTANRPINLAILGCVLGSCGIALFIFWNKIFYSVLQTVMTLSPNGVVFTYWQYPSEPFEVNVYFFNWTNPEEFRNRSTKPILKECGPYTFTEQIEKVDVKWHSDNGSVSYRKRHLFYFDAERSIGTLGDKITSLNPVALTVARKTKELSEAQAKLVSMGLDVLDQPLYVTKTVDESVLAGYSNNILSLASTIPMYGSYDNVPDRFAWLYGMNGSDANDGVFTIHTGAKNAADRGIIHSWNYGSNTGCFESYCGMPNGSAGEMYPSNLTPDTILHAYSPELFRSVPLEYIGTEQVEGITGYKYVAGLRYMDNGTKYPENKCFCNAKCYPSGILDVSRCRHQAPFFTSLPHFYQADPYYLNSVEGLEPKEHLHEVYTIVEPRTGVALELAARLQANILVEPLVNVRLYKNVPRIFMPQIWIERKFRIGPQLASKIKLVAYAFWSGYIVASAIVAASGLILIWSYYCYQKEHNPDAVMCIPMSKYKSKPLKPVPTDGHTKPEDHSSTLYQFLADNFKD